MALYTVDRDPKGSADFTGVALDKQVVDRGCSPPYENNALTVILGMNAICGNSPVLSKHELHRVLAPKQCPA